MPENWCGFPPLRIERSLARRHLYPTQLGASNTLDSCEEKCVARFRRMLPRAKLAEGTGRTLSSEREAGQIELRGGAKFSTIHSLKSFQACLAKCAGFLKG